MDMPTALAVSPLKPVIRSAEKNAEPSAKALSWFASIRNATLDALFYDVPALTDDERAYLSRNLLAQGTVLIVQPGRRGNGIRAMTAREFIDGRAGIDVPIKTVVVPGVGSSSLGAGALGRNVADALNQPVAAIVAGYGALDVIADACGGWHILGANNMLLSMAAHNEASGFQNHAAVSRSAAGVTHDRVFAMDTDWVSPLGAMLDEASDVSVLRNLFKSKNGINLLVGHSKGCLAAAFALHDIAYRDGHENLPDDLHVITIGCVTDFPQGVRSSQFLGFNDVLGHGNSRWWLPRTYLFWKTHGLNRFGLTSMKVSTILDHAGVTKKIQ